jgi:hypothetical protein
MIKFSLSTKYKLKPIAILDEGSKIERDRLTMRCTPNPKIPSTHGT